MASDFCWQNRLNFLEHLTMSHMFPQIACPNGGKFTLVAIVCIHTFLPLQAAGASVHYFDISNTDNFRPKFTFLEHIYCYLWELTLVEIWRVGICGNTIILWHHFLIVICLIILAVITHHHHYHYFYQSNHQIRINRYHLFAFGKTFSKFSKV